MFEWVKILHILAIISWMAGLLYLPRLFVYHAGLTNQDGGEAQIFDVMERRLLRGIMNPAMIVSWLAGLGLAYHQGYFVAGWFHGKLLFVLLLTIVHMRLAWHRRQFAERKNRYGSRYYRFLNEAPTLLMIAIVILVVLKPF